MSVKTKAWIFLMATAHGLFLAWQVSRGGVVLSPDLLFWGVILGALNFLDVHLPVAGRVTMGFVGALGAGVSLSPGSVSLLATVAYWDREERRWIKEAFNRSQLGLAAGLASYLYHTLGETFPSFLLGAIAYFVINTGSVIVLFWTMGKSPGYMWRRNYRGFAVAYLGLMPLAYLMGRVYGVPLLGSWSGYGVLVLLLPVVYARTMWAYQVNLLRAVSAMVHGLVRALEARDAYTALHSERVAAIALDIGREMGLSEEELSLLERGARLHDVGKVGVPDQILRKESSLTPEEWSFMRRHPELGEALLSPLYPYLGDIAGIVLHHHERFDGQGYPQGLSGHKIPLLARIVAVADTYEAMTSHRPYRRAKKPEEALREIQDLAGTQFDPRVVEAFVRVWRRNPFWKERASFLTTQVEA